jgi:hypothetical protein
VYLPCNIVSATTLDNVGSFPTCISDIEPETNRAYALDAIDGSLSEYELFAMRQVKTVPVAMSMIEPSEPIRTSVGFAVIDNYDQSWALLVQSSRSVNVPWSAADATRISQIATYEGSTPAQVQKNGIAVLTYLAAVTHPNQRTPWTPTPVGTDTVITSTWQTSDLPLLRYVEYMYSASDINAVRLGVYTLSYLLALQGH